MSGERTIIYRKFGKGIRGCFALAALLLAGFILVKSLAPVHTSLSISNMDKIIHGLAYFTLGSATLPALPRVKPLLVWGLLCLFGGGIEVMQGMLTAGRTASFFDGLANAGGALAAVLFWLGLTWVITIFRHKDEKSAT